MSASSAIAQNLSALREELSALRKELPALRKELPALRKELPALRKELPALRKELPALRKELPALRKELPALRKELSSTTTTLLAVSKEQPLASLHAAYAAGQRHFAENKAQALVKRHQALPLDIHWHMVGHLQSNKVKQIAPFVHLIHSLDSLSLLETLEKEGHKHHRLLRCLLQVHIAQEPQKHGLHPDELHAFTHPTLLDTLSYVSIEGLMGMATFTTDERLVHKEFSTLQTHFHALKKISHPRFQMKTLSMGMSQDYRVALAHDSTMIRLGTAIFGPRRGP